MKLFCRFAAVLFCGLLIQSTAQVHGVPASVTSSGGVNGTFIGIPASVSSLGPLGLSDVGANPFSFPSSPSLIPTTHRNRLGRVMLPYPVPLFYLPPVLYYPSDQIAMERIVENDRAHAAQPPSEPQRIVVEIVDKRQPIPTPVAPPVTATVSKQEVKSQEEDDRRIAKIFIFHDGSRKELKDFAIMDNDLIDLSDGRTRHFPLQDLDRNATVKINAENGVDVLLPSPLLR